MSLLFVKKLSTFVISLFSSNLNLGLKEIDDQDYINKLEDIFNKKLSSLSNINSNLKRKKIISYLLYRGWESNLIFSKVNEI